MYYVSGVVKDEKGVSIPRVVVSNGKKGVFTDKDGNYQIETDVYNNKLRVSKIGYLTQTIDLSKYQNDSSVNGSVTLKADSESSSNPNAGDEKSNDIVIEEKGLTKKQMKVIGFSLLGVALILTTILIFKAKKK
jgi:hypothetical protein